jgi:hypothetical protein
MRIFVDGDACPKGIKEILFRVAERRKIPTIFVANSYLRLPPSTYIEMVQVTAGVLSQSLTKLKNPRNTPILDGCQAIELLRRREVLIDVFGEFQLFLFNHVHKFNACECSSRSMYLSKTSHWPRNPLNVSMVLFHDIVEILDL